MINFKELFTKENFNCEKHGNRLVSVFKGELAKCDLCLKESEEQEKQMLIEKEKLQKIEFQKKAIEARFNASMIPPRFQQHSFESYIAKSEEQIKNKKALENYAINFEENLKKGNSVILSGNVGTGKTHLACAVGNYIIKNLNRTALFLNAIDAFSKIKETYSKKSEISEIEAINQFVDIDLLILDEFGVQVGSETEKLILFRIINRRYEYLKPTILITNLSVAEIKKFEERIFDRLKDNGILLNFVGESNRKSKKL
jgi:DNA replication protein DnaC